MDWGKIAVNVLSSKEAIHVYVIITGIIIGWLFDNYVNKPDIKALAKEIAEEVEKETDEGTPLDTFLDEFIKKVQVEKGRVPTAGELKTALDVKNKKISIGFKKRF